MNTSYNKNHPARTKLAATIAASFLGVILAAAARAQDPVTGKYVSFKGIVLQKQNDDGGFFLN